MKRRGFTLTELLFASALSVFLFAGIAALMTSLNGLSSRGIADYRAKEVLFKGIGKMAPVIRSAMFVGPNSDAAHLFLTLPATNADQSLVVPLQAGSTVEFYLSDKSGDPNAPGTILWKSVDGVPDQAWTFIEGSPNVDIGSGSLQFVYLPASNPSAVQILVNTNQVSGVTQLKAGLSSTVCLRNNGKT